MQSCPPETLLVCTGCFDIFFHSNPSSSASSSILILQHLQIRPRCLNVFYHSELVSSASSSVLNRMFLHHRQFWTGRLSVHPHCKLCSPASFSVHLLLPRNWEWFSIFCHCKLGSLASSPFPNGILKHHLLFRTICFYFISLSKWGSLLSSSIPNWVLRILSHYN